MWTIFLRKVFIIITICVITNVFAIAQANEIILIIQLTEGMEYLELSSVFTRFEEAHANVKIVINYDKPDRIEEFIPFPFENIDDHLKGMDKFTCQADILVMSVGYDGFRSLSREATRAGYILDLAPLFYATNTDDQRDYYTTVFEAAQWDNGLWILPTSAIVSGIIYDPSVFDLVGLSYPEANWTASDFVRAANLLAERDTDGKVISPGFFGDNFSDGGILNREIGRSLFDNTQIPEFPRFSDQETLKFASEWMPAFESGAIFSFLYNYEKFIPFTAPLKTGALRLRPQSTDLNVAPFPGGGGVVSINGLAVSARTQHPELAYELATYLAKDIEVAQALKLRWGGMSLARPQYSEESAVLDSAPTEISELREDVRTIVEVSLNNGIPASEIMDYSYFRFGLEQAAVDGIDPQIALIDSETKALSNLEIAASFRNEVSGVISTPIPQVALEPGEIELYFYHQEGSTDLWQLFVEEFALNDPQVARVVRRNPSFPFDPRETDCFYYDSQLINSAKDHLLDISPLMAADPEFHFDQITSTILPVIQQGEAIYALPLDIRPLALWYDADKLSILGLQPPSTFNELTESFKVLSDGSPVVASFHLDLTILMFLASLDAIPIKYDENPVQVNFTDDQTITAIEQVLSLVSDNYLKYSSITGPNGISFPDDEPFIVDFVADSLSRKEGYVPILFPVGREHNAISYRLMAGYISKYSQYPEACYRLLQALAHRPDLLGGLTLQAVELNNSHYTTFYENFTEQLKSSNIVTIPVQHAYSSGWLNYWLLNAFDSYLIDGADLFTELTIAEDFTNDYIFCVNERGEPQDCALSVDPTTINIR